MVCWDATVGAEADGPGKWPVEGYVMLCMQSHPSPPGGWLQLIDCERARAVDRTKSRQRSRENPRRPALSPPVRNGHSSNIAKLRNYQGRTKC